MNDELARAIALHVMWRGEALQQAQAFLLSAALHENEISGAILPGEITQGSAHLSGIAVKTLLTSGLLEVTGFAPSPNKSAHGRIVRLLRIPEGKRGMVRTWLVERGYQDAASHTQTLLAV